MRFVSSYKSCISHINKDKKEVFEIQNRRTVERQYTVFKKWLFQMQIHEGKDNF